MGSAVLVTGEQQPDHQKSQHACCSCTDSVLYLHLGTTCTEKVMPQGHYFSRTAMATSRLKASRSVIPPSPPPPHPRFHTRPFLLSAHTLYIHFLATPLQQCCGNVPSYMAAKRQQMPLRVPH